MAPVKIQNVLYNNSLRKYSRIIVIVAMVILFSVVGLYIYRVYVSKVLAVNSGKNVANADIMGAGKEGASGASSGKLDVMFFSVDWCPHCVKAKPDWAAFVQEHDGKVTNGYMVTCVGGEAGVNCTNSDDANVKKMTQQYKIEGYPTLKFIQNGTVVDFDAKITKANMEGFMKKL